MHFTLTRLTFGIAALLAYCLFVPALLPGGAAADPATPKGPVPGLSLSVAPPATADSPDTHRITDGGEHVAASQADLFPASERITAAGTAGGLLLLAATLGLVRSRRKAQSLRKSEILHRTIAENMHHWEFWTAPDGRWLFSSHACERISGYAAEAFKNDPDLFLNIITPGDQERYRQALRRENPDFQEFRIVTREGGICRVEFRCRQMRDAHGNLLSRHGTVRDITARRAAEERLWLAQYAIDSSSHAIGMATMEGDITYANQALQELFGYASDSEMIGRSLGSLLSNPADGQNLIEALQTGGNWHGELPAKTRQGSAFELEIQAFVTRDTHQTPLSLTAYFSDVTSKKAMEREIRQIAYCDALTGLPNRVALKNKLERALTHAARTAGAVAVLMLDLDDFKQINDTIGHAKGDELLLQLTGRLRTLLGDQDTLARLGGDEFVLVLPDVRTPSEAAEKTERILAFLNEKPFDLGECQFFSSASVGITLYPRDGDDAETLLKHADMAMYAAKHDGRNTYRFFSDEIHRKTIERHQLEAGLRRAIRNEEFFLEYQPQVELATGRVVAVEALVRWQHPETGVLSPGTFIAVAEETGLIHAMGEWILHTACHQAVQWQREGLPPMRLAVNLSAQQFRQPGLVERIEKTLGESGLAPHLLELEITESVFMENLEGAIEILVDLKTRAIQIAIDDFGTGYSSLSYLKNFPIDRIKIAQDFVRDIPADQDDATIVETIMVMANRLGLKVIAEGVETEEQVGFLHQRGCREMQGYYFARPMRAEKMQEFLASYDHRCTCINAATASAAASGRY